MGGWQLPAVQELKRAVQRQRIRRRVICPCGNVDGCVPVSVKDEPIGAYVTAPLAEPVPVAGSAVHLAGVRRRNCFHAFSAHLCLVCQHVPECSHRDLREHIVVALPLEALGGLRRLGLYLGQVLHDKHRGSGGVQQGVRRPVEHVLGQVPLAFGNLGEMSPRRPGVL